MSWREPKVTGSVVVRGRGRMTEEGDEALRNSTTRNEAGHRDLREASERLKRACWRAE